MTAYKAPSRDLGEKLNVPELWNDWGFRNHEFIQERLLGGDVELEGVLTVMIMRQEPRFVGLDTWWVLMGAVSQYNFDDIEYFCNTPHWMRENYEEIENYQRGLGAANQGWVMSPKTYELLKSKI